MITLDARLSGNDVIISQDSFEHLLACLDNQKFVRVLNADALTCDYKAVQKDTQEAIDDFNRQCRELLHQ